MKLFKRIGRPALAAIFVIVLDGCSTKDSAPAASSQHGPAAPYLQPVANDTTSTASAQPIPYPLDTCVESGDKLGGDMGPPIVFIYSNNGVNQEIKFCCPDCKPKFLKDPDKYMKIIRAAEAQQHQDSTN
jgi:hypothetical protein